MFKNLVRAPQRDAFWALKKKVDEHVFRPPVPLSENATLRIVCHHVQHAEELLEEREVLLHRDGPHTERAIDFIERRIDESVAAARLLVCALKNRTNAGGNGDLKKELLRLMHPDKNTTKNRDELFESLGAATALINDKM